jgi:hypothetical protein
MSASQRARQARLSRQASVMQEVQKAQDKDSLDGRYARLMVRETAAGRSFRSSEDGTDVSVL